MGKLILTVLMLVSLGITPRLVASPGEEGIESLGKYGIEAPAPAPAKSADESAGPFPKLVIENVMLIDGLGSPPRGPVNIHIEKDKIVAIRTAMPARARDSKRPPAASNKSNGSNTIPLVEINGEYRIDGAGMTALPGLIDAHTHIGTPSQALAGPLTPPEYVFKLWLAHGITTVRETGSTMGLGWTVDHARRSADGLIVAPRIIPYAMFPGSQVVDASEARKWVRAVVKKGALGVKLRGGTREALIAVYDEAKKLGIGTASHHDQNGVYHVNALDSARAGLDSMEHWYGLPEALFTDRRIQNYPPDYNYADEQWRFSEAGRLWEQAAEPGSAHWQAVMNEMLALEFTLVPTFTIYEANRDVMRARDAEWHATYTWPALQKFFMPDPRLHGSYHFDWTTADEVAWGNNFKRWMQFVNEYKNLGGRVAAGSDAGFIFKLFGFAYIRELELLQEAGFHPLEVIQAATLNGAELMGLEDQIGSITPGKQADIVLVAGNPVANFKLLYGTGHMKLNRSEGKLERVGGVSYTIKNGTIFNAKRLLADVAEMVRQAKK